MEIGTEKKSGTITLKLGGDMTIYAVRDFKERFMEETARFSDIEIDVSGVSRLDTAGFQALLLARRAAESDGKSIRFTLPSQAVQQLFLLYNEKIEDWSVYGNR